MNLKIINKIKNSSPDKKRLLDNFLSLGALQIMMYIIPLVTLPYLSRVLGVEKFGLVFFAYAFAQYFNILTDFGFGLSAVREIAVNRENPEKISEIFSAVMLIKAFLLIISFLIMAIIVFSFEKFRTDWLMYLYTFVMVIGNAFYPVWFFQGIERMKYITFLNIMAKLIFLALIFVFVKKSSDYTIVPVLNSLGFLVSGLLGFFIALKQFKVKLYIPRFKILKTQFKHSAEFFLSRVSVSLYTNTNAFFLGVIDSNVMVGYYVAAEKLYQAFDGIFLPINNVLYPYISKYKNINLYKKIFYISIIVNIIICVFMFIFAKDIVTIFYGSEMIKSANILRIFMVTILFLCPAVMLGYPLLAALGHSKEANLSVIVGSVVHISGLVILFYIGKISVYSIAFMVLLTQIFVFSIRTYNVKKYNLWNLNLEERNY